MITEAEHWRTLDAKGICMPWYTRAVCNILTLMDWNGKRVFEYGCGQSTLWYREQGAIVEGVDSNPEWATLAGVPCKPGEKEYLNAIYDYPKFDVVCIDGIYRDQCFEHALKCLNEDGIIIIDNFEQPSVQADWPLTRDCIHMLKLKLKVYGQPGHPDWQTAMITR